MQTGRRGVTGQRLPVGLEPANDHRAELERRCPRLAAYLAGLPSGLASYPECEVRSSVHALFTAHAPPLRGEVPPLVADLLGDAGRGWTPEVRQHAALLAIADLAGQDERAFRAWSSDGFRLLYHGVIYRALMALFSPDVLMQYAPARYAAFHRGTRLTVARLDARRAEGRLAFPPGLFGALSQAWLCEAFAGAFRCSRALQVSVTVIDASRTEARFLARWD
jgi:hypothetical protein